MTYDPAKLVAFDCETHLIQPGLVAPPLVCGSIAALEDGAMRGQLLDCDGARSAFRHLLGGDWIIVGANIAYDLLVLAVDAARRGEDLIADIFRAYDEGRVYDVQIAEALHAVGHGHLGFHPDGQPLRDAKGKPTTRYSLDNCVKLVLGRSNAKVHDRWRLRYHELEHLPIQEWPDDAKIYPVDDAVNTLEVALAQIGSAPGGAGPQSPIPWRREDGAPQMNLHDLAAQCRAAWALHLGASWGFCVDGAAVDQLEASVTAERESGAARWVELGLLTRDKKGELHQDLARARAWIARAYGATEPCPTCGGRCTTCGGTGQVARLKITTCVQCEGGGCEVCAGRGEIQTAINGTKKCPTCHGDRRPRCEPDPLAPGQAACYGTGLLLIDAVPRTEKGGIAYGRDALSESGDEDLINYAAWSEDAKIANVYVPFLRGGVGVPLTLSPNVLLVTGRASYSGVIQLLPREGGVRECIVARPGKVLVSCDYGGLELATHAQSCLWLVGYSKLAEAINGDIKVHDAMGARLGGISYEEMLARTKAGDKTVKAWRQAAKAANFGFPGGMGAPKLVLQKRKEGTTAAADGTVYKGLRFCVLMRGAERCGEVKVTAWGKAGNERSIPPTCKACIECSEDLRAVWFEQWPENRDYFRLIGDQSDRGWIEQHVSRRIRGGVDFTNAANGYFQSLAADGAKLALYRVSRECYAVPSSALYGASRVILFAHDELIVEVPEDQAHEAAVRIGDVMVGTMREYTPDVAVTAEPALMRKWFKGAEPVYVGDRLIPWEPKAKAA